MYALTFVTFLALTSGNPSGNAATPTPTPPTPTPTPRRHLVPDGTGQQPTSDEIQAQQQKNPSEKGAYPRPRQTQDPTRNLAAIICPFMKTLAVNCKFSEYPEVSEDEVMNLMASWGGGKVVMEKFRSVFKAAVNHQGANGLRLNVEAMEGNVVEPIDSTGMVDPTENRARVNTKRKTTLNVEAMQGNIVEHIDSTGMFDPKENRVRFYTTLACKAGGAASVPCDEAAGRQAAADKSNAKFITFETLKAVNSTYLKLHAASVAAGMDTSGPMVRWWVPFAMMLDMLGEDVPNGPKGMKGIGVEKFEKLFFDGQLPHKNFQCWEVTSPTSQATPNVLLAEALLPPATATTTKTATKTLMTTTTIGRPCVGRWFWPCNSAKETVNRSP